jgi:hypothetical protein
MVNRMVTQDSAYLSVISETGLRRQIDRSVSRALVDAEYARLLLSDPTVVLEDRGCPPQQYLSLRSIEASSLLDFARQARALFWSIAPSSRGNDEFVEEEGASLPLPAAAG